MNTKRTVTYDQKLKQKQMIKKLKFELVQSLEKCFKNEFLPILFNK